MTYQFPPMYMFEKGIQSLDKEVNMIKEKHLEREIIWEMS